MEVPAATPWLRLVGPGVSRFESGLEQVQLPR